MGSGAKIQVLFMCLICLPSFLRDGISIVVGVSAHILFGLSAKICATQVLVSHRGYKQNLLVQTN